MPYPYSTSYQQRYNIPREELDPSLAYSPIFQGIPRALVGATEMARTPQKTLAEYSSAYQQRYPQATQRLTEAERVPDIDFSTWPKQTGSMIDDRQTTLQEVPTQPGVVFDPGLSDKEIQAIKTKMAGETPKGYYSDEELAMNKPTLATLPGMPTTPDFAPRSLQTIPTTGRLTARRPIDVTAEDYVPDITEIRGSDMTLRDFGAGLAYDEAGNLVPGASPDRERSYKYQPGIGPVLASDTDQFAAKEYQRGQEFTRGQALQELKNLGQVQAQQAAARGRTEPQKRFTNVTYDQYGNTRDYDPLTGESRTNGIYDKFLRPTIGIAANNPELAASNLSKLSKTNPEVTDQIINRLSIEYPDSFKRIMELFKKV